MRRHRIHEGEVPAVRWGLHRYLSAVCDGLEEAAPLDVINGFRLFYRVMNCRIGQPDYPSLLDEEGRLDYGAIKLFLGWAEEAHPELANGSILLSLPQLEVSVVG